MAYNCANCCNGCYTNFYNFGTMTQMAQAVFKADFSVENSTNPQRIINDCANCYQCQCNQGRFSEAQSFSFPLIINVVKSQNSLEINQTTTNNILYANKKRSGLKVNFDKINQVLANFPESYQNRDEIQELSSPVRKALFTNRSKQSPQSQENMIQDMLGLDTQLKQNKRNQPGTGESNETQEAESDKVQEQRAMKFLESSESAQYNPRQWESQLYMKQVAMQPTRVNSKHSAISRIRKCDENGCNLEEYF